MIKTELPHLIGEAMKSKDTLKLKVLRLIKSEFMKFETAKIVVVLDEVAEINILKGMIKQRNQSILLYLEANRKDLADQEQLEIDIIETFLPKMLSKDELNDVISSLIKTNTITDMKGMGIVMGSLKKQFGSTFDAGLASKVFKELLSV